MIARWHPKIISIDIKLMQIWLRRGKKMMECINRPYRLNYAHLKSCRKPHSESIKSRTAVKAKSNRNTDQRTEKKHYLKKSEIRWHIQHFKCYPKITECERVCWFTCYFSKIYTTNFKVDFKKLKWQVFFTVPLFSTAWIFMWFLHRCTCS